RGLARGRDRPAAGPAVVVAGHRRERLLPAAGRVVLVEDGRVTAGPPADLAARLASAPAIVRLGVLLGWSPPPLSPEGVRPPPLRPGPGAARAAPAAAGPGAWSP